MGIFYSCQHYDLYQIMGGYCIKLEFPSVMAILANIRMGGTNLFDSI